MLTEQKVLHSVEVLPQRKAVNVCWMMQILRDGEVVTETPHRCAYSADQKEQFLTDVEGAESYLPALAW